MSMIRIVILTILFILLAALPSQRTHATVPNVSEQFNCFNVTEIPQDECEALVALYNGTDGPNWRNTTGWLVTNTPCSWHGVSCDEENVVSLILRGEFANPFGLEGALPAKIGNLSRLKYLDLSLNNLNSLPNELGNLSNLTELDLSSNQLSSVPAEIGNLNRLEWLQLHFNQLDSLPASIGNLNNLTLLSLSGNRLSSLPTSIGNLDNLIRLYLSSNRLSSLPSSMGKLNNLSRLYLDSNYLSSLPAEIWTLTKLRTLNVSLNALSNLSADIRNLDNLTELDLSYNRLAISDNTLRIFLEQRDDDWTDTQTLAPTALRAIATGYESIELTWVPIAFQDKAGYYEISIATGNNFIVHGTTSGKGDRRYTIDGLSNNTTYNIRIRTYTARHDGDKPDSIWDDQPNELWSDYSETVSATTQGPSTPTPVEPTPTEPTPILTLTPTPTELIPTATPTVQTPTPTPTTLPTPTPDSLPLTPIPILANQCQDILPPEDQQETACLVGIVYTDGQPTANMTVQIQNQSGRRQIVHTQRYPGAESRAHYRFNLAELDIQIGQSFSVITQHGGQIRRADYVAQPDLQQLDIVFPSENQRGPIATIRHLSGITLDQGQGLVVDGNGFPGRPNTTIIEYRWQSDRRGHIGSAPRLDLGAGYLDSGRHTISLEVQDSTGSWSAPIEFDVHVVAEGRSDWTLMLYFGADFEDDGKLERRARQALARLEKQLDTQTVQIAALLDGPEDGDSERWQIRHDRESIIDTTYCGATFCEAQTDRPETLADFIRWAQSTLPAERYYLAIASHGQAIQGTAWDHTSDLTDNGVPDDNSAYLSIRELGRALREDGIQPVDILHLDACSMNLLESAFELQAQTDLLISSQYLAWDYFAYDQYLPFFTSEDPQEVAKNILTSYADLAQADRRPHTISALDMGKVVDVSVAINRISDHLLALIEEGVLEQEMLESVREEVQTFNSNKDHLNEPEDYYIDLIDWSTKLTSSISDQELKRHATALTQVLIDFIIDKASESHHLPPHHSNRRYVNLDRANGLSIFYPMDYDTQAYNDYINHRLYSFTEVTSWPDFLESLSISILDDSVVELAPLPGPLPYLEADPEVIALETTEPTEGNWVYLPIIKR